ncbi:MAG: S46 family peptidase [Flavobacteriales bacterium]|nr:S46 family peptidase [Flavobacteriales bacterium]MCB9166462.1 S46 family peptidase [Flavobacteriales bacterium]
MAMHVRRPIFFVLALIPALVLRAHEGMWLPSMLAAIQDSMQAEGLHLTAEDIYSMNRGSLKDAVMIFGGGCTAEVVSDQGLVLTNHHCGFSAIQRHSTVDHDHLRNGFWAMDRSQELLTPGLTVTFIVRMVDVTERILGDLDAEVPEQERAVAVEERSAAIAEEAKGGGAYGAVVRAFDHGLQFILIVSRTYRDVRLVGAPPGAIGKFGGDTDNWMWPRHTGDFSVFRIYAGPGNLPADAAPENVPYHPGHVLPISMKGVREGDFAMIFGFPGRTQRYLPSAGMEQVMEVTDPVRIAMRRSSLAVIDEAMRGSDRSRIMYASKQSGISNGYKKWIGELRGLRELHALERRKSDEERFRKRATAAGREDLVAVLDSLRTLYDRSAPYALARDLFIEIYYYGPDIMRFAEQFRDLVENGRQMELEGRSEAEIARLRERARGHFEATDPDVDRRILAAVLPYYLAQITPELRAPVLSAVQDRSKEDIEAFVNDLYDRSWLTSPERLRKLLARPVRSIVRELDKDPAYLLSTGTLDRYRGSAAERYALLSGSIDVAMRKELKGAMELFPDSVFWPDANGTLRLSYGHIEGSMPRDGVDYLPFTTLAGIMDKRVPGDPEFDVPDRLVRLYQEKDLGPYGVNGSMPVCFTASLHTTGGNSGSPVLNGDGELIGINFDRTWESTMSDIRFDPAKCRNISVDIRYVLFIIDKLCGAGHLVDEMQLVHDTSDGPRLIPLPIHR